MSFQIKYWGLFLAAPLKRSLVPCWMPSVNEQLKYMENAKMITIEVGYAKPDDQLLLSLEVDEGTTVEDAVKLSGMLERYPEIDFDTIKMGVFGKVAKRDVVLKAGDRVELYRVLIADPKAARQKRADKAATKKTDGAKTEKKAAE